MAQLNNAYLVGFDAGYRAGIEAAQDLPPTPQETLAAEAHQTRLDIAAADEDLRRLDVAESAGEAAYAAERQRQGLVTYDRHREYVS